MLDRLRYRPDGRAIPLPVHLFFFITLVFGLAFVLPAGVFNIGVSELFKFSALHHLATIWGAALLIVSVLNTLALLTRNKLLVSIVGAGGFACWTYAAIAYIIMGLWLGLAVALTNMIFWAWYSSRLVYWQSYLDILDE